MHTMASHLPLASGNDVFASKGEFSHVTQRAPDTEVRRPATKEQWLLILRPWPSAQKSPAALQRMALRFAEPKLAAESDS